MADSSLIFDEEHFDEKLCLSELQDESQSMVELKNIISSTTWENPLSGSLFKGKYLVFILENLLSWQKPLGGYFHSTFAICGVKLKKSCDSENTVVDESNYSGNPLLVHFEQIFLHNSSDSHTHFVLTQLHLMYYVFPLPETIGRKLLFLCNAVENPLHLPFVALCHSHNPKQQVLLGAFKEEKVINLKLINLGSVFSMEKLPKIVNLKNTHLTEFQNDIKSNVSAYYDFFGCEGDKSSSLVPVKGAKLSFHFSWSEPLSLLEPFTSESICTVKISTVSGDNETGAFKKYRELKFLKTLQHNLVTGEMTWSNPNSTYLVMEKVKHLINEEKNDACHEELLEHKHDVEHIEKIILTERDPLYFTDKLWLVMKDCYSFDEMAEALVYTYEKLLKCFNFQPRVHREDCSTIAKDLLQMSDKPMVCTNISPEYAGKLLLEIGIEKMQKDYKQFFIGLELIPHDLFNHFVQHELCSLEAINSLEKLHSVLELSIICVKQLQLPKKILSEFVRSALKHYTQENEVDLQHVFHIHVPTIYAQPLLTQMRPIIWELSFLSSDKNFLKQSVHRFTTTATEDHLYAPQHHYPRLMFEGASYVYLYGTLAVENTSFFYRNVK